MNPRICGVRVLGSDRDVLRRERDNGLKSMYLRIKLGFGICERERERARERELGERDTEMSSFFRSPDLFCLPLFCCPFPCVDFFFLSFLQVFTF